MSELPRKSETGSGWERLADGSIVGSWWQPSTKEGRLDCLLCPRQCSLAEGDRGFCFVRENRNQRIVLSTYGRSTGFCIDPIEKKPLNHFYPGSAVLSFGTAGCNLGCQFCQNWDISKSREIERLSQLALPEQIARAAQDMGCKSVAFTYNDPVIWAEYAIDTARECRSLGIKTVAVTAGYISPEAREEFFHWMDAANIDLKAFTEEFYHKITYSHLQPVLDTLRYVVRETPVWTELTNLIIPNLNDSLDDLRRMCDWVVDELGEAVPVHFTAFHPDFRMLDRERTDPETLVRAYDVALQSGIKFPYVGNVFDTARQSTRCPACSELLIERNGYQIGQYCVENNGIDEVGRCRNCDLQLSGRFDRLRGEWGSRRQPVRISDFVGSPGASKQSVARGTEMEIVPTGIRGTIPLNIQTSLMNQEHSVTRSSQPTMPQASVAASASGKPLNLARVSSSERATCLQLAATGVVTAVTGRPMATHPEVLSEFTQSIVMGAFVTLKRGEQLRSCCGVLGKPMAVGAAISSAALRAAREDQRAAPISSCELRYLDLEVTLLGPFNRLESSGKARAEAVVVGKHGVMIQRGQNSGLLLPSVATERGWDNMRFLCAVCQKAGLPTDAWQKDDSVLLTFEGLNFSRPLSELLPEGLPNHLATPLNREQVAAYSQVAGQNIAAITSGATPSYVVPQLPDMAVNALVLSLLWGEDGQSLPENQSRIYQGNAIQVSFRPGVPLQSSLFQMSQHAASLFAQQDFSGQLKVGLTVGFDPAMHGYGMHADLRGVDTSQRAVVLSDSKHCGIAFNPEKSAVELRDMLRQAMPVGSRDGAIHTVQYLSTMPYAVCVSAPNPMMADGVRAPAVAGKFYPAEDAARRAQVDSLLGHLPAVEGNALSAVVPHAGLKYSGRIAAQVWQALELNPDRTIIVVSPKHTSHGVNWAVCPSSAWGLSATTTLAGDSKLARQIVEKVDGFELDAAAHAAEHGIEVQLPILERISPKSKVIGIAMSGGNWEEIRNAASQMADLLQSIQPMPLLIVSSDMNHYADDAENRRRDRLALDALSSGDPQQVFEICRSNEISVCGLIPAMFVMETLRQLGHELHTLELGYATSADVTGEKSQVVGYAGVLLTQD